MATLWKPDTCGCEIEVQPEAWGDTDDKSAGQVVFRVKCEEHAAMGLEDKALFNQIYRKENAPKNMAVNAILAQNPTLDVKDIQVTFDKDRKPVLTAKTAIKGKYSLPGVIVRA